MPKSARELALEVRDIYRRADAEGRDLTAAERGQVEGALDAAESQHRVEGKVKELGRLLGPSQLHGLHEVVGADWGGDAGGPEPTGIPSGAFE